MGKLKNQAAWSNAESAILPVVEKLFAKEERLIAFEPDTEIRYDGVKKYVGSGAYQGLKTRVILVASPDARKAPAELFPVAIGPLLERLDRHEVFPDGRLGHCVQRVWSEANLSPGDFPGFHTNESYYFAFCREMLVRLNRVPSRSLRTDAQRVVWIRDTQVKALEVAASHIAHGWSAEEIRHQHPGMELPAIYAALAWYYENRAECDKLLKSQLEHSERLWAEQGDTPLSAKLRRGGRAA